MQLITHQNHIDRLPQSALKTHIQKRFNQIISESDGAEVPVVILVEPKDSDSDHAFIGPNGLLTDLWEEHEPQQERFVRPYEWVSYWPDLKLYEVLFLVCGEDGYWILIPEEIVESNPDLKWVLTAKELGGLSPVQPL